MNVTVLFRRATAATAAANNVILGDGEGGYEKDTGRLKIGDGVRPWNSLPYFGAWSGNQTLDDAGITWTGTMGFPGATTDAAFAYRSNSLGLVVYGAGTSFDLFFASRNGEQVMSLVAGSRDLTFGGSPQPNNDGVQSVGSPAARWARGYFYRLNLTGLPAYASDAAAAAAGLASGEVYKSDDGAGGFNLKVKA